MYKCFFNLLIAFLCISITSCYNLSLAEKYYSEKNYELSLQEYKKALEKDSNNPKIIIKIAEINSILRKHNESIEFYNRALEINPNDLRTNYELAKEYIYNYDFIKAGFYLNKANNINSELPYINFLLASVLYKQDMKNSQRSITYYEKTIELEPKFIDSYLEIAKIYYSTYKIYRITTKNYSYDGFLNSIISEETDNSLETSEKEYLKAIEYYKKVLELSPNNFSAHFQLGYTYLSKNYEDKQALYQLLLAFDINPDHKEVNLWLANYYHSNNDMQKAKYYFNNILKDKNIATFGDFFAIFYAYTFFNRKDLAKTIFYNYFSNSKNIKGIDKKLDLAITQIYNFYYLDL